MKNYTTDKIRNVSFLGHRGSGKTSLVEALLFAANVTSKMGSIEKGNTISDYDDEEINRGFSINTSVVSLDYQEKIFNIYGDSSLVIEYWSKGFIKKDNVTPKTYELAMKVKERREFFEAAGGKISHISGDFNPADLGFHK